MRIAYLAEGYHHLSFLIYVAPDTSLPLTDACWLRLLLTNVVSLPLRDIGACASLSAL